MCASSLTLRTTMMNLMMSIFKQYKSSQTCNELSMCKMNYKENDWVSKWMRVCACVCVCERERKKKNVQTRWHELKVLVMCFNFLCAKMFATMNSFAFLFVFSPPPHSSLYVLFLHTPTNTIYLQIWKKISVVENFSVHPINFSAIPPVTLSCHFTYITHSPHSIHT